MVLWLTVWLYRLMRGDKRVVAVIRTDRLLQLAVGNRRLEA